MLLCLSVDHRHGSLPLLERLSGVREADVGAAVGPVAGSVLLATCNRFELYLDTAERGDDPGAETKTQAAFEGEGRVEALLDRLAEVAGVPAEQLRAAARITRGPGAVGHLFAVAAGLESAVVGEEEIAGQVRRAHIRARELDAVTDHLERLFQAATRTARAVGRRTELRTAGRSLVGLALRMAESRVRDWAEAPVLLIGTGAYAGAVVAALRERGARRILVHSPSGRAARFAADRGLAAVASPALRGALAESELVIACSRVDEPVLGVGDFDADAPGRSSRLLIDLGMPRNIDPAVSAMPGVELLDLDTLASHAPVAALGAEAEAAEIVRAAAEQFIAAQAERDAVPALLSLRGHVLTILEEELCRARRSGEPGTAESVATAEAAMRRLAGRLLHDPTTRIRELGRQGRSDAAREAVATLFGL